eukprot:CAMPEP_0201517964 /NCGR_PEP_ID=MMETSP0161_2-20130828/8927_1 /ASSEMBLY_ACC=CAM_ASM_000251 /TAXON_ID=180227 /ORGANISM="Neoparamoeba aestuarina, Strain SoJaBio B1-5/56/2" /LENGTH=217 /DNA_ID=CAMNT_0047915605 /DNA_START=407 /DNA_END=1056 /DNA_ORIENTATION=-
MPPSEPPFPLPTPPPDYHDTPPTPPSRSPPPSPTSSVVPLGETLRSSSPELGPDQTQKAPPGSLSSLLPSLSPRSPRSPRGGKKKSLSTAKLPLVKKREKEQDPSPRKVRGNNSLFRVQSKNIPEKGNSNQEEWARNDLLCEPESGARYRVAVLRKKDIPPFGPLVAPSRSNVEASSLSDFILETVIQAHYALLSSDASKQRVHKARESMLSHMFDS